MATIIIVKIKSHKGAITSICLRKSKIEKYLAMTARAVMLPAKVEAAGQSSTGGEEEVDITRDEAMDTEGGDIRETTEKERAGLEAGVETDEAGDAAGTVDKATASRTTLRTRQAGTTRYSTSEELLYLHHGTTYL